MSHVVVSGTSFSTPYSVINSVLPQIQQRPYPSLYHVSNPNSPGKKEITVYPELLLLTEEQRVDFLQGVEEASGTILSQDLTNTSP